MPEETPKRQRFSRHVLRNGFAAARERGRVERGGHGHPQRLVSLVLVDGRGPDQVNRTTALGAFVVDMLDEGPCFALHYRRTQVEYERRRLFARVRELSGDRHVVLSSPHPFETFSDHCHILLDGLAFLEVIEADGAVLPAGFTLLNVPERSMDDLSSAFGLPGADGTDLMSRARYASVRVQVAWLAYVSVNFDMRQVRSLFAAYRAWQALERARPLPF